MKECIKEIESHLQQQILPFWKKLLDTTYGGLYGSVSIDLEVDKKADKSLIYIARCLYFFSSYDAFYQSEECKKQADSCYDLLINKFYDKEYGGMYTMLHHDGAIDDDDKHVYGMSFAIYGLSAYAKAYHHKEAKAIAMKVYNFLEQIAFDKEKGVYWEQFTYDLKKKKNTYLSNYDAPYTYNTHLHLLESYTALYEVSHDACVRRSLEHLLSLFKTHFYRKGCHYIRAFLDEELHEIGCLYSVAHDIEASWLFAVALRVLHIEDKECTQMIREIYQEAVSFVHKGHMNIAYEAGVVDTTDCWWAQAEAMIGFLYAYEDSRQDIYVKLIDEIYVYTKTHFFDSRINGEWLSGSLQDAYVAGPWKGPYHTGRFALEFLRYGKRTGVL